MARTQKERKTIITDEPSLCPEMEDLKNIGDSITGRISEESKNGGMEKTDEKASKNDEGLENLEKQQSSSEMYVTKKTDEGTSDEGLENLEKQQSSSEMYVAEKTDEGTSDEGLENLERKQSSAVSSETSVTEKTDKEASDEGIEYLERKQSSVSSETYVTEFTDVTEFTVFTEVTDVTEVTVFTEVTNVTEVTVFTEVAEKSVEETSKNDEGLKCPKRKPKPYPSYDPFVTTTEEEMTVRFSQWSSEKYTEGEFWMTKDAKMGMTKDAKRERTESDSSSDVGDILQKLRIFKMQKFNERRLNILGKYYIMSRKHCSGANFYDRFNEGSDKSPERIQDMPCQCHLEGKIGSTREEKEELQQGGCEGREEPKQRVYEEKEELNQRDCEEKEEPKQGFYEEKELNQGGCEEKEVLNQKGCEEKEEPKRGFFEQSRTSTTSPISVEHNNTCNIRRLARYFSLIAEYFTDEEVDPDLFVLCSPKKEKYRDSRVDYRKKIKNKTRQIMLLKLRDGLKGKLEYYEFDKVEKIMDIRDMKRWCIYRATQDLLLELMEASKKTSDSEESSVEESGSEESGSEESGSEESGSEESGGKESGGKESNGKESSSESDDYDQKLSKRKAAIDPEKHRYKMLKLQYSQLKKRLNKKAEQKQNDKTIEVLRNHREGFLQECLEHIVKSVENDKSKLKGWVAAAVRQELGDEEGNTRGENEELESEKDVEMGNEPQGTTNEEEEKELERNEVKDKTRESVVEGNSEDINEKSKRKNVRDEERDCKRLKMEEQTYENQEGREKSETESTKREENERRERKGEGQKK